MTPSASAEPGRTVSPFAYPLDEFYAQAGRNLPLISAIPGDTVPEPARTLLVHQGDMTSTLENFHGQKLKLTVLNRQQRGDFYFREVVLSLEQSGRPVEFGAIKITLSLFPPSARRQILEEAGPLGRIIREHGIVHHSRPKAFLKIVSDDFINQALALTGPQVLYGRRNTLQNESMQPLAEIVEILPPTSAAAA